MKIVAMNHHDLAQVKKFTDRWIGMNYYSIQELEYIYECSQGSSFLAFEKDELVGVRLTLAAGSWMETTRGLSPELWKVKSSEVAYFKSLFICQSAQAKGLGRELSHKSIEALRQKKTKAILCHCWMESPNNSSFRYLSKMDFREVARWPKYWYPIDYDCTRCGKNQKCVCTAIEMICYL